MTNLELTCWIEGTEPQDAFPVAISQSEKVSSLRKKIYELLGDKFAREGISPFDLRFWRVDIPINNELKDATRQLKVENALFHHQVLSRLFLAGVDEENIHIVVRAQTVNIGIDKKKRLRDLKSRAIGNKRPKLEAPSGYHSQDGADNNDESDDVFKHVDSTSSYKSRYSDDWLFEIHGRIWNRTDLRSQLFHKVEVTLAHYHELQKQLKELNPDRDSSDYNAGLNKVKVLSTKLALLQFYQPPPAAPQDHPDSEDEDDEDSTPLSQGSSDSGDRSVGNSAPLSQQSPTAKEPSFDKDLGGHSDGEDGDNKNSTPSLSQGHPDSGEKNVGNSAPSSLQSPTAKEQSFDEDLGGTDPELEALFPTTFSYLDLSSLNLQSKQNCLPQPLLIREEYGVMWKLIDGLEPDAGGSAIVSGQPGIGKTAFLHLKIVEFMISGREFLYQAITGHVYHCSSTIQKIRSWASTDSNIVAFIDADIFSIPRQFLLRESVQIIAASSPRGTNGKWMEQGPSDQFVHLFALDLWSPAELFLTGIFLHSTDHTFVRLRESASYFGLNPRRCYRTSSSVERLEQVLEAIREAIDKAAENNTIQRFWKGAAVLEGVSHAIFEISPHDNRHRLPGAQLRPVSPWAFDQLMVKYEAYQRTAALDFYNLLSGTYGGLVRGQLFERQVLRLFDSLQGPHEFKIRSLDDSTHLTWHYPGPTKHADFGLQTLTSHLLSTAGVVIPPSATPTTPPTLRPHHLVPFSKNFPAVDSIIYDPDQGLTCIQVTITEKHMIAVQGLKNIQRALKKKTVLADLRPTSQKPWNFVFAVPANIEPAFQLQALQGDTARDAWAGKIKQYVLPLNLDMVFRVSK